MNLFNQTFPSMIQNNSNQEMMNHSTISNNKIGKFAQLNNATNEDSSTCLKTQINSSSISNNNNNKSSHPQQTVNEQQVKTSAAKTQDNLHENENRNEMNNVLPKNEHQGFSENKCNISGQNSHQINSLPAVSNTSQTQIANNTSNNFDLPVSSMSNFDFNQNNSPSNLWHNINQSLFTPITSANNLGLPMHSLLNNMNLANLSLLQQHQQNALTTQMAQAAAVASQLPVPPTLNPIPKSLGEKKHTRTVFSISQLDELEKVFQMQNYIVGIERTELAQRLRLTENQVKIWFQNRRIKAKKNLFQGKNNNTFLSTHNRSITALSHHPTTQNANKYHQNHTGSLPNSDSSSSPKSQQSPRILKQQNTSDYHSSSTSSSSSPSQTQNTNTSGLSAYDHAKRKFNADLEKMNQIEKMGKLLNLDTAGLNFPGTTLAGAAPNAAEDALETQTVDTVLKSYEDQLINARIKNKIHMIPAKTDLWGINSSVICNIDRHEADGNLDDDEVDVC